MAAKHPENKELLQEAGNLLKKAGVKNVGKPFMEKAD